MKIIKKGKLPQEKEFYATCRNCKCEFSFKQHEAQIKHSPRNEAWMEVKCPMEGCGSTVHVDWN